MLKVFSFFSFGLFYWFSFWAMVVWLSPFSVRLGLYWGKLPHWNSQQKILLLNSFHVSDLWISWCFNFTEQAVILESVVASRSNTQASTAFAWCFLFPIIFTILPMYNIKLEKNIIILFFKLEVTFLSHTDLKAYTVKETDSKRLHRACQSNPLRFSSYSETRLIWFIVFLLIAKFNLIQELLWQACFFLLKFTLMQLFWGQFFFRSGLCFGNFNIGDFRKRDICSSCHRQSIRQVKWWMLAFFIFSSVKYDLFFFFLTTA